MSKLMRMLQEKSKGQKPMSPLEKDAKMKAVGEMRKMASDEMAVPLHGLKKVSVMSNSPEGVEHGLDKAKELVKHMPMEEGSPEEEASESAEEESQEDQEPLLEASEDHGDISQHGDENHIDDSVDKLPEHMSEEEIDQKLQELMHAKAKLQSQKM